MKNALYIVNVFLLIAVGVLFYLFFTEKKTNASIVQSKTWIDTSADWFGKKQVYRIDDTYFIHIADNQSNSILRQISLPNS